GRLDYAAGNLGLNTKYQATPERPAVLYSGVFEEGGKPQLIEAHHEGDKLFPFKGRATLGKVIPSLLKRFPTNPLYARATIEEIFPVARLSTTQRLTATEFQSGVFLSQPNGSHRFDALSRMAQIAPIYGMAAGDFDGDGKADLYVVQNSYAPIPETGRFDGGLSLLLRGDGHGHFDAMPALESGLIVPGDAKGLVVGDFDDNGWPDFFITRNNDITLAYLNRGAAGQNCFGVSLHGPKGNVPAVGALIKVVMTDGSFQAAEVSAGGGYLSQSGTVSFFGYSPTNPPKEIRVRWPSGKATSHSWLGSQKIITFAQPAD
ncbi:MAG TPA: CRTAC1 family protein, partial [Bacteroidia bacterium]|nr:CRTAC1 family protein [Bacteroidia bacterium]